MPERASVDVLRMERLDLQRNGPAAEGDMLDDDTPLLRHGTNAPSSEGAMTKTRRKLSASFFFLGLLK